MTNDDLIAAQTASAAVAEVLDKTFAITVEDSVFEIDPRTKSAEPISARQLIAYIRQAQATHVIADTILQNEKPVTRARASSDASE